MEWIPIVVIAVLALIIVISNIHIVQQSRAYVIERLGAFSKVWQVGMHVKVPFIERVAKKVSLKEQVLDYPPQPVITKDNVTMQIDTVVYYQITDPRLYTYGVERPMMAMETLTATTLRNIIGDLELDQTLTSRDVINTKMRAILDEATDPWGIKVNRVELKNILPPQDIQNSMEKQMKAERDRRQAILQAEFDAHSFEDLFQGVKAVPLERFIPKDGAFPVKGYSLNSQLHSVPDCQAIVKKAAVTRLGEKYGLGWLPETGETYQLRFSIMKDHVELFLDTSGVSLHKRGYRREANLAPLHETMAAAMVNLARYRGRDFFWDPFCGSGTICIEAAMIALNRAPGLNRSFMAQKWACVPETVWQQARTEALDREYRGEYRILGSDIDPASLEIAQQNARKAGVGKLIEFREADATKMSLPADKGLIVCNPPYGERMLEQRSAQRLYSAFGRHLKYADGWKKYIISSEPEFEHYYGKQAVKKRKLYNGRLQCNVYMYY